jgi:multimeric flavodoxin WrbA
MTKVLIVSATPRKKGNSDILADRVAAGARAAGAQVEKVRLAELKIGFCKACNACQKSREAPCVQKDDMAPLLPKILEADVIVLATPIYYFSVSGQMKVFLDRTYALGGGDDWTAMSGKRAALVFTYAEPNALYSGVVNAFRMFQDAFEFLGVELVDCVHAACSDAGEVASNAPAMTLAEELGRKLASH